MLRSREKVLQYTLTISRDGLFDAKVATSYSTGKPTPFSFVIHPLKMLGAHLYLAEESYQIIVKGPQEPLKNPATVSPE